MSSSKTEARPLRPRGSQCPKTPSMVCRPVWAISCVQRRPIKSLMLRRLTASSTTVANRSQFKSASTSLSAGEGVRFRTVASAGSSRSARASAALRERYKCRVAPRSVENSSRTAPMGRKYQQRRTATKARSSAEKLSCHCRVNSVRRKVSRPFCSCQPAPCHKTRPITSRAEISASSCQRAVSSAERSSRVSAASRGTTHKMAGLRKMAREYTG